MSTLLRAISAEALKLRRTLTLWTTVAAPLLVVLFQFFNFLERGAAVARPGADLWSAYARGALTLWSLFMLPLLVALQAALLAAVEHGSGGWRRLFALPAPRWSILLREARRRAALPRDRLPPARRRDPALRPRAEAAPADARLRRGAGAPAAPRPRRRRPPRRLADPRHRDVDRAALGQRDAAARRRHCGHLRRALRRRQHEAALLPLGPATVCDDDAARWDRAPHRCRRRHPHRHPGDVGAEPARRALSPLQAVVRLGGSTPAVSPVREGSPTAVKRACSSSARASASCSPSAMRRRR